MSIVQENFNILSERYHTGADLAAEFGIILLLLAIVSEFGPAAGAEPSPKRLLSVPTNAVHLW
jgi:hypothetical protein